jgi:hypothetical protein
MLKAIIAKQGKENFPIHNLNLFAEIPAISNELSSEQFDVLAELTPYHIEARYGDYKEKLSEIIDEQKAQQVYKRHWRSINGFIRRSGSKNHKGFYYRAQAGDSNQGDYIVRFLRAGQSQRVQ